MSTPDESPRSQHQPIAKTVPIAQAVEPFVLAIDIGSGSTRGSLYDGYARPVKKRIFKAEHVFTELADGTAEIDADRVVDEVDQIITQLVDGLDPGTIEAVVMDTFASSLVCVDTNGRALTPCITYADGRSAKHLAVLRKRLDETEVHQRIGARLHTSYHPPRMLWLREEFPGIWARTEKFVSLGEYIYARLAGVEGAATSTMAWAGILNRHTLDLDEELLEEMALTRDRFAGIVDPEDPITDVSPEVARRWPALAGAAWFPAIPDGLASNLGVGADTPNVAAMSAATSGAMRVIVPGTPKILPSGLWAYSVSKDASIVGGALNDVGRVMLWLERTFAPATAEEIDRTLRAKPKDGTPLVLPFFTGERATGWAGDARAVFTNVSSASTNLDFWRGAGEGIAVSYARVFEQLQLVNPQMRRVVASGGVTQRYGGVMDIVAQALGFPVQVVDVKRVTMRGAAVLALRSINPDQQIARIPETGLTFPEPAQHSYYNALRRRFEDVYNEVIA
ncbi:gluconokinase [Gulosibacter sp. 10]|uniref:gluconokinase n=1 Tax=Gulosibacter sp. 10 TaxID=1255570 RepID=UPI00097EFC9B|nr:gluconokinase [Gulosibacter sp. 10]SJM71224.1 Gluconokinase [Gulosibacter sp. 10]